MSEPSKFYVIVNPVEQCEFPYKVANDAWKYIYEVVNSLLITSDEIVSISEVSGDVVKAFRSYPKCDSMNFPSRGTLMYHKLFPPHFASDSVSDYEVVIMGFFNQVSYLSSLVQIYGKYSSGPVQVDMMGISPGHKVENRTAFRMEEGKESLAENLLLNKRMIEGIDYQIINW